MKIIIAQTNTTPLDFEGNTNQIKQAMDMAQLNKDVKLVVTPELSIPGYLVKDLVYNHDFVSQNLTWLQNIVNFSSGKLFHVVVGYIDKNYNGQGKPFRNMLAVIRNGTIVARYQKQLLPFYDVFDEGRYFEPGNKLAVVEIEGKKWGLAICEDIWNDKNADDYNYKTNPLAQYREIGITNIISINSSPYVMEKPVERIKILKESFAKGTLIYVNQIGGQDDLVFDGHSLVIEDGRVTYKGKTTLVPSFNKVKVNNPKYIDVDILEKIKYGEEDQIDLLWNMLVLGLRDYIRKSGFNSVVFGSSGGIDSAVVAALACDAIGEENVYGIRMPSIHSSDHSLIDAKQLQENLKFNDFLLPIGHVELLKEYNKVFETLKDDKGYNDVADQNMQARIRGAAVMHVSNAFGMLPISTGNKSELSVGYCTIYGDMCGGFAPISDVYKTIVYALAEHFNKKAKKELIPVNIIKKPPSAELAPDQKDDDNLLPYDILDPILYGYIECYISDFNEFRETTDIPLVKTWAETPNAKVQYNRTISLVDRSEFKRRQAALGIKVCSVAFGSGRRVPIVKAKRIKNENN